MEGLAKQLSKELEDPKFAAVYYRGLLQDAQDIITSLEASVADAQELYAQCKAKLTRAEKALQEINMYWYKLHNSPWQKGKTCEAKIASALKKFFKQ